MNEHVEPPIEKSQLIEALMNQEIIHNDLVLATAIAEKVVLLKVEKDQVLDLADESYFASWGFVLEGGIHLYVMNHQVGEAFPGQCFIQLSSIATHYEQLSKLITPKQDPSEKLVQDFAQIPVPDFSDFATRFNGGRLGDLWANIQYHKNQITLDPLGHILSVDVAGPTSEGSERTHNFRTEYRELDIQAYPLEGTTQRYVMRFSIVDLPVLHAPLTIFQRFNRDLDGPDVSVELTGKHQFYDAVSGDIQVISFGKRIRTGQQLAKQNTLIVLIYNHEEEGAYQVSLNGQLLHQEENINTMPSPRGTWWQFGLYWHGIQDSELREKQIISGQTQLSFIYHYAEKMSYPVDSAAFLPGKMNDGSPCMLPKPWQSTDIGGVEEDGNACHIDDRYVITAAGADIWDTDDAFHFQFQSLEGEGNITARILSLEVTDPWAKAGIMIRENLESGSRNVFLGLTAERGITFQTRSAEKDLTSSTRLETIPHAPIWVKIERRENVLRGYYSSVGVDWELLDEVQMDFTPDVFIGLAVTSHDADRTTVAEFDSVNIENDQGIKAWGQESSYLALLHIDDLFTISKQFPYIWLYTSKLLFDQLKSIQKNYLWGGIFQEQEEIPVEERSEIFLPDGVIKDLPVVVGRNDIGK